MAETYYREAIGNASFYPGGSTDPVRGNAPFTPVTLIPSGTPSVPILGVLVLVAVALWFEHQRRRRSR